MVYLPCKIILRPRHQPSSQAHHCRACSACWFRVAALSLRVLCFVWWLRPAWLRGVRLFFPSSNNGIIIVLYSSFRVRLCRTATERVYRNSPFRYARRVDARGVAERAPPNGWSCGSTTSLFVYLFSLSLWVEPDSYFSYFHITWVISSSELRWLRERGGRGPFLLPWRRLSRRRRRPRSSRRFRATMGGRSCM